MELAGLVLAVPGVVKLVHETQKTILQYIPRTADIYGREYQSIVRLNQLNTQLLLQHFSNTFPVIDEGIQDDIEDMFEEIRGTYDVVMGMFDVGAVGKGKKLKLSPTKKKKADLALEKLEKWNDRFLKLAISLNLPIGLGAASSSPTQKGGTNDDDNDATPTPLQKVHTFRDAVHSTLSQTERAKLDDYQLFVHNPGRDERKMISDSGLELCSPQEIGKPKFLIEYRTYNDDATPQEVEYHRKVTWNLAHILHAVDPQVMGLLRCEGFGQDAMQNRFELRFTIEPGFTRPQSLLHLLQHPDFEDQDPIHPLNDRIELAKSITSALFIIHAADFVHKSVRPDNIMVLESTSAHGQFPHRIGKPFLFGFDGSRKVDAASQMLRVEDWRKNLYLSPERHRLQKGDEFRVEHDLYSLGVVLIEIGLWTSFQDRNSPVAEYLRGPSGIIKKPEDLKEVFRELATDNLAATIGRRYAEVATTCLNGLRDGSKDSPAESISRTSFRAVYLTQVIRKLEEIQL